MYEQPNNQNSDSGLEESMVHKSHEHYGIISYMDFTETEECNSFQGIKLAHVNVQNQHWSWKVLAVITQLNDYSTTDINGLKFIFTKSFFSLQNDRWPCRWEVSEEWRAGVVATINLCDCRDCNTFGAFEGKRAAEFVK